MNVLLPTAYFPPISYFLFLEENHCMLEVHENFMKQTLRNRCLILGANGVLPLIVPIKHNGNRLIKDIEISYSENWRKDHWKSIQSAYRRSPFFEYYEDKLAQIFQWEIPSLIQLNSQILQICAEILQLTFQLQPTKEYESDFNGWDERTHFNSKNNSEYQFETYSQVFEDRFSFKENLSILDLICNLGPQSHQYLTKNKLILIQ